MDKCYSCRHFLVYAGQVLKGKQFCLDCAKLELEKKMIKNPKSKKLKLQTDAELNKAFKHLFELVAKDPPKKKRGRPLGSKNKPKVFMIPAKYNQDNCFLAVTQPMGGGSSNSYYLDWSVNVKAPISNWMNYKEMVAYQQEWYPNCKILSVSGAAVKTAIDKNTAGKDGLSISFLDIQEQYGLLEAKKRKKGRILKK